MSPQHRARAVLCPVSHCQTARIAGVLHGRDWLCLLNALIEVEPGHLTAVEVDAKDRHVLAAHRARLLLGPDGEQVPLPEDAYRLLVEVVEAMREGKVITLVPRTQRLTTQKAADFPGVSRPTMVKLLEDGKIPHEQPGRHRRVLFTDLLAYTERQHASRRAALDRMTGEASEAGIYGGTPEDYHLPAGKQRGSLDGVSTCGAGPSSGRRG